LYVEDYSQDMQTLYGRAVAPEPQGAGTRAPSLQMAGYGRQTWANTKLTKLCCPSRKRSPNMTNCTCRAKKVEGHDKTFSEHVPPPAFKFVPEPQCPSCPEKFIRDGVVAPLLPFTVVIVILPQ